MQGVNVEEMVIGLGLVTLIVLVMAVPVLWDMVRPPREYGGKGKEGAKRQEPAEPGTEGESKEEVSEGTWSRRV